MELSTVNDMRIHNGRPKGSTTYKTYKWKLVMYDKHTKTFREGKYCSIPHLNKELNLNLTSDIVMRLRTHYRTDTTMKHGEGSFLAKYGHIQLTKINELKETQRT